MTDAAIDAQIQVSRGAFTLDVRLRAAPGTVVAVLGPNGAGKTTLLRVLAGLQQVERGSVRLAGRVVDSGSTSTGPAVFVPARERAAGVVFQDYLLFPHLSVLQNVAFGPQARRLPGPEDLARQALDRLGIGALADRRPATLSGGQAQRVALARALAIGPQVLLLDEPLAALDVQVRDSVRAELATTLRSFPGATVLVTHDPQDAFALADQVVVIEGGRVTQVGSPASLVHQPMTAYVAALTGTNRIQLPVRLVDGRPLRFTGPADATDAVIDPRDLRVHLSRPESRTESTPTSDAGDNLWPAVVDAVVGQPDGARLALHGVPEVIARVSAAELVDLRPSPGMNVWVSVPVEAVRAWRAEAS